MVDAFFTFFGLAFRGWDAAINQTHLLEEIQVAGGNWTIADTGSQGDFVQTGAPLGDGA